VPPEKRDHGDPDHDVENGAEDLGRAPGEERQQSDLNGVCDHGDDPRGEDPALRLLHASTLGSASRGGQTLFARETGTRLAFPSAEKQNPGSFEQLNE
jgi:hypothetical protein